MKDLLELTGDSDPPGVVVFMWADVGLSPGPQQVPQEPHQTDPQ